MFISVEDLKTKLDNKEAFQLVDIREEYELQLATIGGEHIPLGEVMERLDELSKDIPVVFYCKSGQRAGNLVQYLRKVNRVENYFSLEGGITAWSEKIDHSVKLY